MNIGASHKNPAAATRLWLSCGCSRVAAPKKQRPFAQTEITANRSFALETCYMEVEKTGGAKNQRYSLTGGKVQSLDFVWVLRKPSKISYRALNLYKLDWIHISMFQYFCSGLISLREHFFIFFFFFHCGFCTHRLHWKTNFSHLISQHGIIMEVTINDTYSI